MRFFALFSTRLGLFSLNTIEICIMNVNFFLHVGQNAKEAAQAGSLEVTGTILSLTNYSCINV
jgi:hypothetical protein